MKICFIQNILPHYRVPLFNLLSKKNEITIICRNCFGLINQNKKIKFKVIEFNKSKILFNYDSFIYLHRTNFDIIVLGDDIKNLWIFILRFFSSKLLKKHWIIWGINDSNFKRYIWKIKKFLFLKRDIIVFYDYSTCNKFINAFPINYNTKIVANNSVEFPKVFINKKIKKQFNIINVGTLAPRKRNDLIIDLISSLKQKYYNVNLILVGDGIYKQQLKNLVFSKDIVDRVKFIEHTDNISELYQIYSSASISISLGQAGLAVQQSLGFSTPFITLKNAISGGEIYNIINGYNGYLLDSVNELEDLVIKLINDKKLLYQLSKNAYEYSKKFSTIANYANSFDQAFKKINVR